MTYFEQQEKIWKKAADFIKKHGQQEAYDFATWILEDLRKMGFCIWQTYTVDDIEACEGKRPSKERMRELSDSLQCFENIRF